MRGRKTVRSLDFLYVKATDIRMNVIDDDTDILHTVQISPMDVQTTRP